jgi:hypothetical protein
MVERSRFSEDLTLSKGWPIFLSSLLHWQDALLEIRATLIGREKTVTTLPAPAEMLAAS